MSVTPERESDIFNAARKLPPRERGFYLDGACAGDALLRQRAVELWDVGTRQELLTLVGTGSLLGEAKWSADGHVILAGSPWQAWYAPSWAEIAAAEANEKAAIK